MAGGEEEVMANNRLYIRCRVCGGIMLLAKHFTGPWSVRHTPEVLDEFFEEHFLCANDAGGSFNGWYNTFDLVSEMGEGFPEVESFEPIDDKRDRAVIDWSKWFTEKTFKEEGYDERRD